MYGDKIYKPYRPLYPTPDDIPLETTCVSISIPENPAFIGLWIAALLVLTNEENFVQFDGALSRETTAEIFRNALFDALTETSVSCQLVPPPYWNNESDNEIELPDDEQTWYGAVADWLAPADELNFEQNIALWVLTGFVAYAATPAAAIYFRTAAKRFIVAIETTDIPEIIRVVVGASTYSEKTIDTTDFPNQILELEFVSEDTETDIYIIQGEFE